MRTRPKKQCLILLPISLLLMEPFFYSYFFPEPGDKSWLVYLVIPGFFLYLWGLGLLAKAKGQSQAILLTVILGVIFPLALLLVIEDKHRYR